MAYRGREGTVERGFGLMADLLQTSPSAVPQSWAITGAAAFSVDQDMLWRVAN